MAHDVGPRDISRSITPVKENYLKILLELSKGEAIRSSDVAASLNVTKASVSAMMKRFSEEGYITMEKYGAITLTAKGRAHAAAVKRRYNLLKAFFIGVLGVDTATAAADACQIEHCISAESLRKMQERLKRVSP